MPLGVVYSHTNASNKNRIKRTQIAQIMCHLGCEDDERESDSSWFPYEHVFHAFKTYSKRNCKKVNNEERVLKSKNIKVLLHINCKNNSIGFILKIKLKFDTSWKLLKVEFNTETVFIFTISLFANAVLWFSLKNKFTISSQSNLISVFVFLCWQTNSDWNANFKFLIWLSTLLLSKTT